MAAMSGEPVIGFRAWRITQGKLVSCTCDCVWKPYQRMEASCNVRAHDGGAPAWRCLCGFYAYKTLETLTRSHYGASRADVHCVSGRVALWGRVIDHAFGYRARHAYPQILFLRGDQFDDIIRRAADRYAIECVPLPISSKEEFTA